MSDAMTNREIEDVLTSIRRLVAQEGTRPSETGRLILTEAQRIGVAVGSAANSPDMAASAASPATEGVTSPDDSVVPQEKPATDAQPATPDFRTDLPSAMQELTLPEPDFCKLEATIAELEAAVSASGESWEPEGSVNDAPRPSNVTDLYGRLSFVHQTQTPEPKAAAAVEDIPPAPSDAEIGAALDDAVAQSVAADSAVSRELAQRLSATSAPVVDAEDAAQRFDATTLAQAERNARLEVEAAEAAEYDAVLDEDTLRVLVAQIVREELHGQLGERVTQQVRKLVRSEIAKALGDRKFL